MQKSIVFITSFLALYSFFQYFELAQYNIKNNYSTHVTQYKLSYKDKELFFSIIEIKVSTKIWSLIICQHFSYLNFRLPIIKDGQLNERTLLS